MCISGFVSCVYVTNSENEHELLIPVAGNILCTRSAYKQIIFKSWQRLCDQIRRKKQREADNNNQNANNNAI